MLGTFGGDSKRIKTPAGFSGSEGETSLLDQSRGQLEEKAEGAYNVIRNKIGTFSRDTAVASGTQAVTGIGFKPQVVLFFMGGDSAAGIASWGVDNKTTVGCQFDINATTADAYDASTARSIFANQGASVTYEGELLSLDLDGFTVNWTRQGATSGTIEIIYVALG